MVNPFVSIDQQLSDIGWKKYYESEFGFQFVKKVGMDVYFHAKFIKQGLTFYDDIDLMNSIAVKDKELELFAAKIKEWRRQYERNTKAGRHSRKERS